MSIAAVLAPATKRPVRVLIVDDSALDTELMAAAIEHADYSPIYDHVNSPESFRRHLAAGDYDVILCDHNLKTWTAKEALEILQETGKQIPFVVVTGTLGDERAVQYLKDGASDYVLKERLDRLPVAIGRALREKAQRDDNARLQRAIWTAKKDWERTFDAIPDSIILLDREHRVLRANRATADLLGLPFSELIGKHCYALVHGTAQPPAYCPLQRMLLSNMKETTDFQESKLGKAFHVSTIPLRNESGPHGAIHVLQDFTESRRMEEALRQAQKLEAVGRLAGGIAHDFNNILGVVLGYSQLLQEQLPRQPWSDKYIQAIIEAVDQAANVTSQLLAFSRKQVLQPTVLDLNKIVASVSQMLQRLIREDIELSVTPEEHLGLVKADRVQMEQVLMNLAVNARDAMSQGGKIVISTANVELQREDPGMREPVAPGSYVMISVSDTGVGMDKETISRVFEPFFTTKEKGTGLGLAIVYGIVKQSGGYISVESEVGRGSTFKIYLPRTAGEPETVMPTHSAVQVVPPPRLYTVLVVEDEPKLGEVVSTVLASSGYDVLVAANAEEAIRIADSYQGCIDLMLTDVVLRGGMNGAQLAKSLARTRPEIKVLFMSGYSDCLVDRAEKGKPSTWLRKPFTVGELQFKVQEQLMAETS